MEHTRSHRRPEQVDVTVESSGRCAVGLRGVWCCRRKHAAPRVNSATAVLLLGIGMLGITRSYDAPRFMEYRSADQVPNGTCIEANGCNTGPFLILGNDGPLPFITPPDGHIFSAEIGGVISFHVAGEQGAAASARARRQPGFPGFLNFPRPPSPTLGDET